MMPTRQGSFHLFRFAGIDVFLHWSWFLVAAYMVSVRHGLYSSFVWNIVEYLALFLIVLMHEFGHSLACRQVGGQANQIVLWPLGGVAYVAPPPRPGPTLWSIAAGPLVNVLLLPILTGIMFLMRTLGWAAAMPDAYAFVRVLWIINLILLVFNMLPVYPLDGGQILRSLLWFAVGRARSLMIATVIGLAGVVGLIGLALWMQSIWMGILSAFILMNCWGGLQQARQLARIDKAPRHTLFSCPNCRQAPLRGDFWKCAKCGYAFDIFAAQAICPQCIARYDIMQCVECGGSRPLDDWIAGPPSAQRP